MKSKMVKIFFPLAIILIIAVVINKFSCSSDALAPRIKGIKDIHIIELDKDSINLFLIVNAHNENDFEINIKELFVNIIRDGDKLGTASQKDLISIPSDSTAEIALKIMLSTDKVVNLFVQNRDSLNLNLTGKLLADVGLVTLPVDVDIPFSFSLKDNLYKTIERDSQKDKIITINRAELLEVSLYQSKINLEFSLSNPYRLPFKLYKYPAKIFVNDQYVGDGDLSDSIFLSDTNTTADGRFNFKLDNPSSIKSIFGSFFSGKLEYETRGTLYLEILEYQIHLPYNFRGTLIKL